MGSTGAVTTVRAACRAACTVGHPARQRDLFDRLAAGGRQPPQCRGWLIVPGSWPHGDEQQVAAGGEDRRGLPLGAVRQPPGRRDALRIQFPYGGDIFGAVVIQLADRGDHPVTAGRDGQARYPG